MSGRHIFIQMSKKLKQKNKEHQRKNNIISYTFLNIYVFSLL